jgi:hypothetical protein
VKLRTRIIVAGLMAAVVVGNAPAIIREETTPHPAPVPAVVDRSGGSFMPHYLDTLHGGAPADSACRPSAETMLSPCDQPGR